MATSSSRKTGATVHKVENSVSILRSIFWGPKVRYILWLAPSADLTRCNCMLWTGLIDSHEWTVLTYEYNAKLKELLGSQY
jgi:hypothetical protein